MFLSVLFKLLFSLHLLCFISLSDRLSCNFNLLSIFPKHFLKLILSTYSLIISASFSQHFVKLLLWHSPIRLIKLLVKSILLFPKHVIHRFLSKFFIIPSLILLISPISASWLIRLIVALRAPEILIIWLIGFRSMGFTGFVIISFSYFRRQYLIGFINLFKFLLVPFFGIRMLLLRQFNKRLFQLIWVCRTRHS